MKNNWMTYFNEKVIAFIIILSFFSLPLAAQQQDENSTSVSPKNLNLNFNSVFQGYFYQDAMSSIIANKLFPIEMDMDIRSYVLGPNDLVTISINANQNLVLRGLYINPSGDIIIPSVGNINIGGTTISEAEKTINNRVSEILKDPVTNISLEYPRPATIFISGEVPYAGKYSIDPFSRTDLAVYYGFYQPAIDTETGEAFQVKTSEILKNTSYDFRNIKIIKRNGRTIKADLVHYFNAGSLSSNPVIHDGDKIFIDRINNDSPQISISGSVKGSDEFVYNSSDTPAKLIKMSGGYNPKADTSIVLIYRNTDNGITRDTVKSQDFETYSLQANDRVVVPKSSDFQRNSSAWVEGEVNIPGIFPIESGKTTVFDLLKMAGDLTIESLPSAAYLKRNSYIENEIPNKYDTEVLKRTSDQIAQGFEYLNLETKLSKDKVNIDLNDKDQLKGVKVFDGDRLYVPRDEQTVFVFGQVNNPGYYPFINDNESFRDYISKAGGFALSADSSRIFIIKAGSGTWYNAGDTDLDSGDRIFVDRQPFDELNAQRNYRIQQEQIKNTRIQLIMTGITTITGIITTYVAIQNIRN